MISPHEMSAAFVIKVGPVKAQFSGKVTRSDLNPPNGYRISGEGSGDPGGFAQEGATVALSPDGPDATRPHYVVDAQIGGKLAQLGRRRIDATAKKLASEFFQAFAEAAVRAEAPVAVPRLRVGGAQSLRRHRRGRTKAGLLGSTRSCGGYRAWNARRNRPHVCWL